MLVSHEGEKQLGTCHFAKENGSFRNVPKYCTLLHGASQQLLTQTFYFVESHSSLTNNLLSDCVNDVQICPQQAMGSGIQSSTGSAGKPSSLALTRLTIGTGKPGEK